MNVQEYLSQQKRSYEFLEHCGTKDAQRMAAVLQVPGCQIAKTVVLKLDQGFRFAVAVLPAPLRIDLKKVSGILGGAVVELATESQLALQFRDCDVGAVPPFGSMYGMLTLVHESLTHCDRITFEGNRHCEAIRMKWQDFQELESPLVADFAVSSDSTSVQTDIAQ